MNRPDSPPSTLLLQSSIDVPADISTDVHDDAHRAIRSDEDLSTIAIPDHIVPIQQPEEDGGNDDDDSEVSEWDENDWKDLQDNIDPLSQHFYVGLFPHDAKFDECVDVVKAAMKFHNRPVDVEGNRLHHTEAGSILLCWMAIEDRTILRSVIDVVGEYKLPHGTAIAVRDSCFPGDTYSDPVPLQRRVHGQGSAFGISGIALPDLPTRWDDIHNFAASLLTMY